jgi:hypothetical protein
VQAGLLKQAELKADIAVLERAVKDLSKTSIPAGECNREHFGFRRCGSEPLQRLVTPPVKVVEETGACPECGTDCGFDKWKPQRCWRKFE